MRRRAVVGAVVDTLRASGVRLVGLVGTIAVARLATPHQLGLVAIGATVIAFADLLDDGGVGTALIRRAEPATTTELRALLAFQLAVDFALVIVIGLAMLPFGLLGQVTTVIAFSLPIGAFRAPGTVTCERRLSYRALAVTDIAQTCVYYTWTVGALVLGGGVWALATGFVVREASGALLLLKLVPEGRMTPAPAWAPLKPLLSFGVKFQAVGLLHMLRDQGVNILVAALGGVSMLGLWSVAWRLIQLPVSLVSSLWRVSMPGMARLVAAKEDVGGTIDRVISLSAIGTGVLLVPLAASAPAWVRVLLGPQWVDAASVIPGACLAMAFGIPISVTLAGYLWALGNASVPLRATAAGIPPTLALVVGLLPHIGLAGVGVAYIASSLVESIFFVVAARRTARFSVGGGLAGPLLASCGGWLCGWLVSRAMGQDLASAISGSATALAVFVGALAVIRRPALSDAWSLIGRGVRGAVARPAAA